MNLKWKYCLVGISFGLMFPVIGTFAELHDRSLEFSLSTIYHVHTNSTLLLIIDLAPIILGIIGCFVGIQQFRMNELSENLKEANLDQFDTIERLDASIARKNKDLNRITYATAHDLRSTLRGISSLISIINSDDDEEFNKDDVFEKLNGRVGRMEKLLDSLMNYVRTTQKENEIEQFDCKEMIEQVAKELGIHKSIEFKSEIPFIWFDKFKFQIVLREILDNAIKFKSSLDLNVEITAKNMGPYLELNISDNGIGIEKEFREKVFDLFATLENRDVNESIGLGLALVRRIIEDHNGEIKIEESDMIGTKLTLKLINKE